MGEGKRRYFNEPERGPSMPGFGEPVGGFGRSGSLGGMLRQARESRGLQIDDVARALRIRPAYLHALEDGRYKELPGATYATGFLRTYAEYVGIDPALAVERFREESSGAIGKSEFYMPQPVPESRIPGGAVLLLALVLGAGVYGGWYYLSSTGRELVDLVPVLPDHIAEDIDPEPPPAETVPPEVADAAPAEPAAPAGSDTAVAVIPPAPETPAPQTPAPSASFAGEPVVAETTVPAPAAAPSPDPAAQPPVAEAPAAPVEAAPAIAAPASQPATVQPAPETAVTAPAAEAPIPPASAPETPAAEIAEVPVPPAPVEPAAPPEPPAAEVPPTGKVYGVVNGGARVQLHAVQDSWVQVRDARGDLLFARVLRPGDVYRVPDQPGLKMVTGNAGGLVVSVDGVRQAQPLGPTGKVVRDVALDPQALGGTP